VTNVEHALIKRAQTADRDAFCLLAKEYERRIYLLALHYCQDPQDAEDLSQEVWLKAYQAIGAFRGESSFYTWLRRITINCFLNHRRSRRYRQRGETTGISLSSIDEVENHLGAWVAASSESSLHTRIMVEKVMQAMAELTPQQRLIFLLKHHEGMTYEEIAKSAGCSIGAAKKSVHRAIAKLRRHLNVESESSANFRGLATKIEIGV
jgi:RNA polymerase sigma-70 factor (ECF subfamily)